MIIGRKPEQKELLEAANSEYSKFVAVYGRRRVGKTFLIRETFQLFVYLPAYGIGSRKNEGSTPQFPSFPSNCLWKEI